MFKEQKRVSEINIALNVPVFVDKRHSDEDNHFQPDLFEYNFAFLIGNTLILPGKLLEIKVLKSLREIGSPGCFFWLKSI